MELVLNGTSSSLGGTSPWKFLKVFGKWKALRMLRCSRKFSPGTTQKVVFKSDFPDTFCKR